MNLHEANRWPITTFATALRDGNARLGANVDRSSFIAVDFHHLLFAGFYRRTGLLDLCKTPPAARRGLRSTMGPVEEMAVAVS